MGSVNDATKEELSSGSGADLFKKMSCGGKSAR
jgi:hypothetical protein